MQKFPPEERNTKKEICYDQISFMIKWSGNAIPVVKFQKLSFPGGGPRELVRLDLPLTTSAAVTSWGHL